MLRGHHVPEFSLDLISARSADTCLKSTMASGIGLWLKIYVEKKRLIRAYCRSVARVLLAYFKGLKRDDVADLDVPLGMLYMLEPVRSYLQSIWTRFNAWI